MDVEPRQAELRELLEEHREEILQRWAAERRVHPKAARLSREDLLDHLPRVLDLLVTMAAGGPETTEFGAIDHAIHRLDAGFNLDEVVEEYAILREVVFEILRQYRPELVVHGFEIVERAIDRSIAQSVSRYSDVRHRTLQALDRLSEIGLEVVDLEALLPRLLGILVETTPAVDSAAILLLEGERLRMRAAVGLIAKRDPAFTLRVGEGFAGTIAATGKPLFIRSAATDPLIESAFMRERGLRALYGVPLFRGSEVMGVAHISSLTAYEFAEEDKLLFRTTADRATLLIVQAEQRAALNEAVEFRDRVIALASHDLRNPLGAVSATARQLLGQDLAPDVRAHLERIRRSAARIEGILAGLLDYTQTRFKGPLRIDRRPSDLGAVVSQAVEELEIVFPRRRVELSIAGDLRGHWDPQRMGQVVSNLVTNALQHGDAAAPVQVDVEGRPEDVRLSVLNRGPGIAPERWARLFEPFRQEEGDTNGFGLGLYIVREIVRAHGGEVGVRSGGGTTVFEVRLPRGS